jgi:ribA/ribD-fused uncharacterized protein
MDTMKGKEPITAFQDDFFFLSNFYPHCIEYEGAFYPTAEHAFQSAKTWDPAQREKVRAAATPASAKSLGKRVTMREGWETLRFAVMEEIVRPKFADPELRERLRATRRRELIERNTWRDTTWGAIKGKDGIWKASHTPERGYPV